MRKIAIVTGIRSEYSLLYPVMKAIAADPLLELTLIVTGAHLSHSFGHTVDEIEKDGFEIAERIESLLDASSLASRAKSAAIQLMGLVQAFTRQSPDIVLAPYDREEALTVAVAGTYMNIPVVHLGGGDRTFGNADDYVRNAVTKLAHIHFVTTRESADRIIRMGEELWRVHCVGNPGLDKYVLTESIPTEELGRQLDFDLTRRPLLVLLHHPMTTEVCQARAQMEIVIQAVEELSYRTVIIYPNSDPGSREMIQVIEDRTGGTDLIKVFKNLPKGIFTNLMKTCDVLVGNSSCGILEAPFLKLPVVNIGIRQQEREHADNVIFVSHRKEEIKKAVEKALTTEFKQHVQKCANPFGDGTAGQKIAQILGEVPINTELLQKRIIY